MMLDEAKEEFDFFNEGDFREKKRKEFEERCK